MKNKSITRIPRSVCSLLARLLLSRSLLRKFRNQNKETIVKGKFAWIPITIRK